MEMKNKNMGMINFIIVFVGFGIDIVICIVHHEILWAIYFAQLQIIVLISYFYSELRTAIWQSRRGQ